MRIDAHQHFWKLERGDYDWITPDNKVLYRDYLPGDLAPLLDANGIDRTIAVQAAQSLEETEYLLQLGEQNERIAGVVGWLDLSDPDCRLQVERFRKHRKYVGFRVMIQEMDDPREILREQSVSALRYFAGIGFPVDLLVVADQLAVLIELLDKVPGLRGVVDHLGKPPIAAGAMQPWMEQMERLSKHPMLYCKLSGMVTEADHQAWRPEDFTSYVQHVIKHFGVDRVMFGSDWPVCLLAAQYDQVISILEQALPRGFSQEDRDKLFGRNAAEFYNLEFK